MFTFAQAEKLSLSWLRTGFTEGVFAMATPEDLQRLESFSLQEKRQLMKEFKRWVGGDPKAKRPEILLRIQEAYPPPPRTGGAKPYHLTLLESLYDHLPDLGL